MTNFGIPQNALDKIISVLKNHPKINQAWIYGSRALGKFRTGSDIDLCLQGDTLNLSELFTIENHLDALDLPWKIDLSCMHMIDNPDLLQHVKDYGQLIYKDNSAKSS